MKRRIVTNSFRNIKKSFPRFLSLIVISMLGVFTFVGLSSTAPDMVKTLDNYLDERNTYDIKLLSNYGLTDTEIDMLKDLNHVVDVEGSYSLDALININEEETVINIESFPKEINKLKLIEGSFPKEDNEIVVEKNFISKTSLEIGDSIYVDDDNLINKELKIVGTVDSSLYFNYVVNVQKRGNTSIGSGSINYYTYSLDTNFKQDYYNNVYLTATSTKDEITASTDYIYYLNKAIKEINREKKSIEDSRYQYIYNQAKEEIDREKEKADDEFRRAEEELASAKRELDNYYRQLNNSYSELVKAENDLANYRSSLDLEWANYHKTLEDNNIDEGSLESNRELLVSQIDYYNSLTNSVYLVNDMEDNTSLLVLEELNKSKALLDQVIEAREQLNKAEVDYNDNLQKLTNSKNYYYENMNLYYSKLNDYNYSVEELNNKKAEVYARINEAYEDLNNIKKCNLYVYDRSDYLTYEEYIDDTNSLKNLSKIFPMVFFAVAVLVSLISMNRMIEDDRGELGTLKSLGFSNRHILFKYLLFSFLATLLGGAIGSVLGLIIIPSLIFKIYKILFVIPNFVLLIHSKYIVMGVGISFLCVCGATYYTVKKELREKPSQLMRPRAPKSGKRVFLENIKFIWKRISFSNKVTIRNLFRYKKRVFVTLVGVAGCCALILAGFGIRDSIMDISEIEYGKIMTFDGYSYINNLDNVDEVFNDDRITDISKVDNFNGTIDDKDIVVFVLDNGKDIDNIMNLYSDSDNKKVSLEEGKVVITEKIADILNIKVGDDIDLVDVDRNLYSLEVGAVVKNYFEHYIIMDRTTFEKAGGEFNLNAVYFNTVKLNSKEKNALVEKLLENDGVLTVNYVSVMVKSVTNMLNSLDEVVFILIVLAALLAFVVLYNLANININERKREIATLKVLGFYNKEVDNYITKETIILTIIGIIIGLIFGYYLTGIIIKTVEIEKARFIPRICLNSYIYAAFMSMLFTLIVNFIIHFSLKKIDMIESLKSVE